MFFEEIDIKDKETIEKYTKQKNYFMCSYCFVDIFMWQSQYNTQFAIEDDILFLRCKNKETNKYVYLCPIGNGDLRKAIEKIEDNAKENNQEFIMCAVPLERKEDIEKILPNKFEFTEDRDSEDYIYLADTLTTLKGKKLHSKRNFINRFKAEYGNRWSYESLNDNNMHEIFNFHLEWCGQKDCNEPNEFLGETCAISKALKNYQFLGIKGGILRLDGKIIAFTLASKSHDNMYIVHIEKASYEISGAYQMINQLFAQENFKDITYVDREEDLGIEGLRKAKESYYPVKMGICYTAKIKE